MLKNLREAKFENYFLGHEKVYALERVVVKSMEALSQSIGGLRSAADTQFALLRETETDLPSWTFSPSKYVSSPPLSHPLLNRSRGGSDQFPALSAIEEASDESNGEDKSNRETANSWSAPASSSASVRTPSDIFELFISLLGPSMKSLAYTLSEVLREPPFGEPPDYEIAIHDRFRRSLTDALGLFNAARAEALRQLYARIELGRTRSEKIQSDFEEVAAACGHFSFSLQAFGEETQKYLDVLDDLKYVSENRTRSWRWLLWWEKGHSAHRAMSTLPFDRPEAESLIKPIKKTAVPKGIPDSMVKRRDSYSWQAAPDASRVLATLSQNLLSALRTLARDDSKRDSDALLRMPTVLTRRRQSDSDSRWASAPPSGPCSPSSHRLGRSTNTGAASGVCCPS
jgi:hypothetical protein